MVAISLRPGQSCTWMAFLYGIVSGGIYLGMLFGSKGMRLDDVTSISQTHGFMAFLSLFAICFFDKDQGFFFKDIYQVSALLSQSNI
jgi:hypothetical protein